MKKQTETKQEKKYFDVVIEALVPTTIKYRILADNEQDALDQINKKDPISFKPKIAVKKLVNAKVYDAGSLMIKYTKTYKV